MHKNGKEGEDIKRNKFGIKCIVTLWLIATLLLVSCAPDGGRNALKRSELEPMKVGRYQVQEFENPLPIENFYCLANIGHDNITEFLAYDYFEFSGEQVIYDCTLKNDGSDFSMIKLDVGDELIGESEEEIDIHTGPTLCGVLTDKRTFLLCDTATRTLIDDEWRVVIEYQVLCYDKKGTLLWKASIPRDSFLEEGYMHWLSGMGATSKNGVALLIAGVSPGDGGVIIVDSKGNASEFIREQEDDLLYSIDEVLSSLKGECYLDIGIDIIAYDPLTGKYGQKWNREFSVEGRNDYGIEIRSDIEILSCKEDGIYALRAGEESIVKVMDYADSSPDITHIRIFDVINEGHFIAAYNNRDDDVGSWHFGLFSYVGP